MPTTLVATVKGTDIAAKISISGRPKLENFLAGYPILEDKEMPSDEVFKSIFGENYDKKHTNACAARVSIALLKSNVTIDEVEGVRLKKVTHGELIGKKVMLAADEMETWLEKKWGKREFEVINPGSIDKIKAEFSGKNGIYIMRPFSQKKMEDGGFGATGHCTLWISDKVIGNHFAEEAYRVRLWELK